MRYSRMVKRERALAREVEKLLAEAEALKCAQDKEIGKNKRGDELPQELRFGEKRLEKIREAKRALEEEARREAKDKETRDKDRNPPTDGDSGSSAYVMPCRSQRSRETSPTPTVGSCGTAPLRL